MAQHGLRRLPRDGPWPVGRVTALMLRATTGIAYIEAERAYESAEGADFDAVHAAYVAHEEAKT